MHQDLYILDTSASTLVSLPSSSSIPASLCGSAFVEEYVWHQRLGHPSSSVLHNISPHLPSFKRSSSSASHCHVCPLAKQKRLAFISNNTLSKNPFDLVHLDIWGPFKIESVEGYKYFLTLVDDCTRVTWIYMLKNKSDVSTVFPAFLNLVSTQFDKKIKAIRSDNAPELAFPNIVAETSMIHYFSCPYTPQQNSVVERKHQHLLNVARSLLFQSNVPLAYWSDCVLTATFLINRMLSPLLNNVSPLERLQGKCPDYSQLKSFGCLCYASTLSKDRHKFIQRASPCVLFGFSMGYKGYKLLDLEPHSVFISRNVIFHEKEFLLKTSHRVADSVDIFPNSILPLPAILHFVESMPLPDFTPDCGVPSHSSDHVHTQSSSSSGSEHTATQASGDIVVNVDRPKRTARVPSYLSEYHCSFVPFITSSFPSTSSFLSTTQDHVPFFPLHIPFLLLFRMRA